MGPHPEAEEVGAGWRPRAACRGLGPEIFYAVGEDVRGGHDRPPDHYSEARRVCDRCPVAEPCAEEALARGERFGLWGGLSPRQRERARRARIA